MSKIGIFFGTDTGRTRRLAKDLAKKLGDLADTPVNINKAAPEDLLAFDALILGTPTLGEGAVPGLDTGGSMESWLEFLPKAAGLNLSGKVVALFGLGDQDKYGEHFVSALRPLHDWALACGARVVGYWPTEGYDFIDSDGVEGDYFLGLAIDQHNQAGLTEERLTAWLNQITPRSGGCGSGGGLMNPWALVKDRGIKRLLVQLQARLGAEGFDLLPRRSDVPEAVTLCKPGEPGLAAFVFTYGQAEGRYGVHLAYPFPDPTVPESMEDLTAARLVELLAIHFDAPALMEATEPGRDGMVG